MNHLDEPVLIAVSKPLPTEFGIHHRFESSAHNLKIKTFDAFYQNFSKLKQYKFETVLLKGTYLNFYACFFKIKDMTKKWASIGNTAV